MPKLTVSSVLLAAALGVCPAALGWGSQVHRDVTRVAIEAAGSAVPAWLSDAQALGRAEFQSNQPDRWRGWNALALKHLNDPEHYLDAELLEEFGLTLETVPRLRREYLRAMVISKHEHPERVSPYDPSKDVARAQEWPGYVLHAIAEEYAKLQAAMNQAAILERVNDPNRAVQLAEARATALYHLGHLSHFVADVAQPLHTTKHFNGWVGDNPDNFRWRDRFHAYIDEGWAVTHRIGAAEIRQALAADLKVDPNDPWDGVLAYFERSHEKMRPLYALERDGKVDGEEGRAMLTRQLGDAAGLLRALLVAAVESSRPTDSQIETWLRYDAPPSPSATTKPAAAATTQPAGS